MYVDPSLRQSACRKSKSQLDRYELGNQILPFLQLAIPAFNAFSFATNLDFQMAVDHAFYFLHKIVFAHAASIRSVPG